MFKLYGSKLEIVTQFKYLGVKFYKYGRWNQTHKCIAEYALKAMQRLFSFFYQYELPVKDKLKLFDVLVSSVLNYSSEVSGYFEAKDIENVHINFLRKCVNKYSNVSGLYAELCRVPLSVIRKVLFIYLSFMPFSTLFQLYHGDSSLIHDPCVNKPVLG